MANGGKLPITMKRRRSVIQRAVIFIEKLSVALLMFANFVTGSAAEAKTVQTCRLDGMSTEQAMEASAEAARSADRNNRYGNVLALSGLLAGCDGRTSTAIAMQRNALWQWRAEFGYYAEANQDMRSHTKGSAVIGSTSFGDVRLEPAIPLIVTEARKTRLVMVDEGHNVPLHRTLTIELLRTLRREGYNYFAAEMLSAPVHLGADGYPDRQSGVYAQEPLAADMIRTAIDLGYKLVAYEADFDPSAGRNWRDQGQAEKLAAVLKHDPKAKILVHTGPGHLDEDEGHNWMGAIVQRLSGVNPLTIDQTMVRERRETADENPSYAGFAAKMPNKGPAIPVMKDGTFWHPSNPSWTVDMIVVYPRTTFHDGRPIWMLRNGSRRFMTMPREPCGSKSECVVSVWRSTDTTGSVPIDQVEVLEGRHPALALPRGVFRAESRALDWKPLKNFPIVVN